MTEKDLALEALEETMKKTSAALREADIPHLLAGSFASWARGGPESRKDLDFAVKPEDADRAVKALVDAGMEAEETPEEWIRKVRDGEVVIDIVFDPSGLEITDEVLDRGEELDVVGIGVPVMAIEDVLTTKLFSLKEHYLDYESLVQMARSLREQVDWDELRRRTSESPYAKAFFTLVEELGIVGREEDR